MWPAGWKKTNLLLTRPSLSLCLLRIPRSRKLNLILSLGIVNNCALERESTLEVINENLSLADHIDFVSKKVNQRFDVLRRIKHLLPNCARNVFVSAMVLPFSDYCDIIWKEILKED